MNDPHTTCPYADRRSDRPGEIPGPRVELVGQTWHIRSASVVRQVLRSAGGTTQAGFGAERATGRAKKFRRPVLFADGEEHRLQRSQIARYFAPKVVTGTYREMMEVRAERVMRAILAAGVVQLPEHTMDYSVDVASQVVGLTSSDLSAMSSRLDEFFGHGSPVGAVQPWHRRILGVLRSPLMRFYWLDVLPAIRERRRRPKGDVISHLIEQGYGNHEILAESITYGAAGMVTTREFISMATWHLVEAPEVRAKFLAADEPERLAILAEILRLEPIVGHLYRRTVRELEVSDGDQRWTIPAGASLDLQIRQANADHRIVGDFADQLCPGRDLPRGVAAEVLSFGDGPHRCPGAAIALQEADILLRKLLACDLTLLSTPTITWDDLISAYAVTDLVLRVRPARGVAEPTST